MGSRRATLLIVVAAALVLSAPPARAAQELYAVGSSLIGTSDLYKITGYRTGSPTIEVIGDLGERLDDVAVDPTTGMIYGIQFTSDNLFVIDPEDASVVELSSNISACGLVALEFDASGQLWGWCGSNIRLYRIDKASGNSQGFATTSPAVASGDLAFDCEGVLWGTSDDDELVRFDLSTFGSGVVGVSIIGTLNLAFGSPYGLEIDSDGTMYLGEGQSSTALARLHTVDTATADVTLVDDFSGFTGGTDGGVGLFGLAFTIQPTPLFSADFEKDDFSEWTSVVGAR